MKKITTLIVASPKLTTAIISFALINAVSTLLASMLYAKSALPIMPATEMIDGLHEVPSFSVMSSIEKAYIHEVEPIFSRKCFKCHTPNHKKKWYLKIPLINQIMERNFDKALKALDLSVGFPFIGNNSVANTLKNLSQSIQHGSMPPPWWTIIYWPGGLSKAERNIIENWVQDGLKQVKLDK